MASSSPESAWPVRSTWAPKALRSTDASNPTQLSKAWNARRIIRATSHPMTKMTWLRDERGDVVEGLLDALVEFDCCEHALGLSLVLHPPRGHPADGSSPGEAAKNSRRPSEAP